MSNDTTSIFIILFWFFSFTSIDWIEKPINSIITNTSAHTAQHKPQKLVFFTFAYISMYVILLSLVRILKVFSFQNTHTSESISCVSTNTISLRTLLCACVVYSFVISFALKCLSRAAFYYSFFLSSSFSILCRPSMLFMCFHKFKYYFFVSPVSSVIVVVTWCCM